MNQFNYIWFLFLNVMCPFWPPRFIDYIDLYNRLSASRLLFFLIDFWAVASFSLHQSQQGPYSSHSPFSFNSSLFLSRPLVSIQHEVERALVPRITEGGSSIIVLVELPDVPFDKQDAPIPPNKKDSRQSRPVVLRTISFCMRRETCVYAQWRDLY